MLQNAWFQLNIRSDGLYVHFYPPVDGGQKLTFYEVNLYLIKNRINLRQSDKDYMKQILENQNGDNEVKIRDTGIEPVSENLAISISNDKLTAMARAYAPSNDGNQISGKEDFLAHVSAAGVNFGIREDIIETWLENRQYCTDMIIAEGAAPEESRNGAITYHFNTDTSFKPSVDENDNIDFHQLNRIEHVTAGDVLAELTPEYEGKHGTSVQGMAIPSRKPLKAELTAGANTELSPDGLTLTAMVTGHVEKSRGKINVHNVYLVKGNVGIGTGDIEYDGSVKIIGDVLTGYSVRATGDIFVGGVVEAASLESGGQIVLTNGMHGDAKGILKAGGNVTAKFLQTGTVDSGGSVTSGSMLLCKITAKDNIVAVSKKGVISGGEYKAGKMIEAITVGAPSKINTQLEIAVDESIASEYKELESHLVNMRLKQRKARQSFDIAQKRLEGQDPLPPDKAAYLETLLNQISALETEIKEKMSRYDELKIDMEKTSQGRVVVKGDVYEGTRITISNISYYVRKNASMCQYMLHEGDVSQFSL